ncbi:MAG: DNA replication and repair protein RecF [Bacteroidetes bacterium]|nr:DNA replication and repair protein RecF [Bacteroidota bacterium]
MHQVILKNLQLSNFKNYEDCHLDLDEQINCFAGNNGAGKTNILDAVHYLCLCKSYFTAGDVQNIRFNEQAAFILGNFISGDTSHQVLCTLRKDQKKIIKHNGNELERLADHIGTLPLVMISPIDSELITEGSDIRRKFIDSIISQSNAHYLHHLIQYNRALVQRNNLLKQLSKTAFLDQSLMEVYNEQMLAHGNIIHAQRATFFKQFSLLFNETYKTLTPNSEQADLIYESQLNTENFDVLLKSHLQRDVDLQYTAVGIHKDDVVFTLNNMPVKKYGSQGQQKSFTVALKLAQYYYMSLQKDCKPILMLDDIYDKLDELRVSKLMQMVSEHKFGQILITDTNAERIKNIFEKIKEPITIHLVKENRVTKSV